MFFLRFTLFLFCLTLPFYLKAQQTAPFDSSYTNTYYTQKVSHFRSLPNTENEIVFLGDSITDSGEWSELFPNYHTKNRGISSDITFGVLARLDEVTLAKPEKVFILIGVNDIARNIPIAVILKNYTKIIHRIKAESPNTQIFVQSLFPTNNYYMEFKGHQNKGDKIIALNKGLKELATSKGLQFVDLYSHFVDKEGKLPLDYTHDGLHLNGAAYIKWANFLKSEGFLND